MTVVPHQNRPRAGRDHRGTDAVRITSLPPALRSVAEWVACLSVIGLGAYGLSLVAASISVIVISLLIATMVAALLLPSVEWLSRRMRRGAAALIGLLGALVAASALAAVMGQQIVNGSSQLREEAVSTVATLTDWLGSEPLNISTSDLTEWLGQLESLLTSYSSTLWQGVLGLTVTSTHLIEGFFIVCFSAFFFLASGHTIWSWLLRMLPRAGQQPVDDAARAGWVTLGRFVRATALVAAVDGVGIGIGVALVGVPLALPLGVIVFVGAFVPVIGAVVTGALAVLVALVAQGWVSALVVLGIVLAVNQLEVHVLQPFLLGRAVSVHPLGVILALAAGYAVAGVAGALFAVPLAAVGNTVITSLVRRQPELDEPSGLQSESPTTALATAKASDTADADLPALC